MSADEERDAPFGERIALVWRRLVLAVQRLDLDEQLDQHPWQIVGVAALLGAYVGFAPLRRPPPADASVRDKLRAIALSGMGALALRLAREAALRHVGEIAKQWWDETAHTPWQTHDVEREHAG
jgi:hypothetical protein